MHITVEYGSESGDVDTPGRFWMGASVIEVQEILDQWPGLDHRYFKVRGHDQAVYILRQDMRSSEWELIFFSQEQIPPN